LLSTAHPFFDVSVEAIHHTLLEDHRRALDHVDASSLLDMLRGTAARTGPSDRTLVSSSRKFALFVRAFSPYFDVLSICTRVKAEWPGHFWALVRLVFQVCILILPEQLRVFLMMGQVASEYVLFLEKIADIFEAMANILPPYHQIYTICKRRMGVAHVDAEDEQLATLMSYAYADMVRICLDFYSNFFRNVQSKCAICNIGWSEH
jgi:hypothetical protein